MNPEFQRNVWLEWSAHRVVFASVVLASIFVLVTLFDPDGIGNFVANTALTLFVLATMIWGSHRAGDAMLDELRERTWDSQRMSAMSPWSMTWGKLCGATIMPWFAGTVCLVVYGVARFGPTPAERLQVVASCVAAALLVQALSLIGALVGTRLEKHARSTLASWAALGTIVLLLVYFSVYYRSTDAIAWFGRDSDRFDFLTVSLFALAGWTVFGAYRMMSSELAVATRPWAWSAFVIYLTIYFAGALIQPNWALDRSLAVFAAAGLVVSIGASYLAAFALYRDPLTFHRLATYATAGQWRRFFEELPVWMASFAIAIVFSLLCAALTTAPVYSNERVETVGFGGIVIVLYAVRNIGLLYYFTYGESHRRVETTTVICIAIISWLLPSIAESMGLTAVQWLLRPPLWDRPVAAGAIIAVHVLVVAALCWRRYHERIAPAAITA
ncbi:MAG: hypothetical protein ACU85U_21880 [Gammaproteobacteria bacterium]